MGEGSILEETIDDGKQANIIRSSDNLKERLDEVKRVRDENDTQPLTNDGKQSRLLQAEREKEFEESEKENEERKKELEGTDIEETHEEYLQKHKDDEVEPEICKCCGQIIK